MSKNSFNLTDVMDRVEIAVDVERTFDVKLNNREAEACHTVGELYDLIVSKRRSVDPDTRACLSQASFYALRRAFGAMGATRVIAPTTPLREVMLEVKGSNSIRQTWKTLGDRAKLKLPPLEVAWLSWPAALWSRVAEVLVFVACGAAVTFALHHLTGMNVGWAILSNILVLPLLAMAILAPLQFCFGAIPRRIETVGDLAREAAGHSFTELWQDKRGYGPADLWSALTAMLRRHTGHQGVVDRETTFVARDARTT